MNFREEKYPTVGHTDRQNTFFLTREKRFVTPRDNCYMIHLYNLNENRFLFQHDQFDCITKDSRVRLLADGWMYWYSLIHDQYYDLTKTRIDKFLHPPYLRKNLRLNYPMYRPGGWIAIQHELSLYHCNSLWFVLSLVIDLPENHSLNSLARKPISERNPVVKESCQQYPDISEREIEVLTHIADGFSSKETAEKLFISPHTVMSHRKNLMQKFNVKNTAQLIKKACASYEI